MKKRKNRPHMGEELEKKKIAFPGKKEKNLQPEPVNHEDDDKTEQGGEEGPMKRMGRRLIFLPILVLAIWGGYTVFSWTDFNSYEVVEETGITNSSLVDYIPYQNSLLKFSKDGALYMDEKGEAVWNETFAMKMPAADVSGEYAAIADLNGNDVYVFDTAGKVSSATMPYKVCDIAVASQGVFAVILEGEKENYINVYDKNGEKISERKTTIDKSGYPMDIDLSEDGEKLFSTYLYLDGVDAKNGLAAYNFGAVGQNENADRLMGGYRLEDTIVPKVEFLDNNTICAFGDNQIIIYSMRQKPSEKASIKLEKEVQSVVYTAEYIGIVVPNEEEDNAEGQKEPYKLELYNTSGRKLLSRKIDFRYENVRMSGNEIIFTGGTECRIYTVKGKLKFSYTFSKNVVDMIPTGYGRRYIILYDNGSEVIKLKHESGMESGMN
ncbi:MAG: DUF5711 family protein [Bacteroidales bacterium]|nr:DUF5711 family protein [Clostridium sp.]MCM1203702.1 DUF5711 family protein [Bacteroidales bacterium]